LLFGSARPFEATVRTAGEATILALRDARFAIIKKAQGIFLITGGIRPAGTLIHLINE
jgi:hypothetical protein